MVLYRQILVDIYSQLRHTGRESPELTSLTTYLAFLRNATMHTVDRLHALVESNNDSLLLVLGSLAEFAPKDVSSCITSHHITCSACSCSAIIYSMINEDGLRTMV